MSEFRDWDDDWPTLNGGQDFGPEHIINAPMSDALKDDGPGGPIMDPITYERDNLHVVLRGLSESILFDLQMSGFQEANVVLDQAKQIESQATDPKVLHVRLAAEYFFAEAATTRDPEEQCWFSQLSLFSNLVVSLTAARFLVDYGEVEPAISTIDLPAVLDNASRAAKELKLNERQLAYLQQTIDDLRSA